MTKASVTIPLADYIAKTANALVQGCVSGKYQFEKGKFSAIGAFSTTIGELSSYLKSDSYGIMMASAQESGYCIHISTYTIDPGSLNEAKILAVAVADREKECAIGISISKIS